MPERAARPVRGSPAGTACVGTQADCPVGTAARTQRALTPGTKECHGPGLCDMPASPRAPPPPRRVLLFSTMTKLLDLLEVYLRWRQLPEVGPPPPATRCHTMRQLPSLALPTSSTPPRCAVAPSQGLLPAPGAQRPVPARSWPVCPPGPLPPPPSRACSHPPQSLGGGTMGYLRIDGSTSLEDRWGRERASSLPLRHPATWCAAACEAFACCCFRVDRPCQAAPPRLLGFLSVCFSQGGRHPEVQCQGLGGLHLPAVDQVCAGPL